MKSFMFVVPSLSKGGAERVVSVLASGLAQRGYHVNVLRYFKTDADYAIDKKVNIITLSQTESEYDKMNNLALFVKMHKIFKTYNPDVIIPFLRRVNIQTVLASFGFFRRIVYTVRVSPYVKSGLYGKVHEFLINHTNRTIVQNNEQKAYYSKTAKERISILPNPVDERFLQVEQADLGDKFVVVSSGRLTNQKNFSMLIKAFSEFAKDKKNIFLEIYGEGQLRDNLQSLINDLNINKIVSLKGRTDDVPSVYKNSSLYVMSSNFEGMPNALLEAMAAGLPCISTDCKTGPKEMIRNKENGLLIPVNDEDELVKALEFMYSNRSFAIEMGKNARKDVLNNNITENIVSKFLGFFE